jgi:ABC-2 type transport system ATP-binding protein
MSISVNNIYKYYGTQAALEDVSFSIGAGEVVGFLGPNGAGKSTMMKIITCYLPQNAGKVEVCGYDVENDSLAVRRNVGYLPELNPLYYDMYVKEYLLFLCSLHKIKDKKNRTGEMIEKVGLSIEQHKKIGSLSKGYKQRVGLAQALIHDPKVLILDEPTTGLDPNQIVEIRSLIKNIGKEKTVMMSTHIMQEVEAICDRVIIINKGKIVADEKAADLKKFQKGSQRVRVEFNSSVEKAKLEQIVDVQTAKNVGENTWLLVSNSTEDIRNSVFQFAVANNISILNLNREELRLEDVFKDLTGKKS